MMRNLKEGSAKKSLPKVDGGELVVRPDGSEVIKVRSKKRRSLQPKKEKEKKRSRQRVILIAVGVAMILLSVIAFSVMLGYYNGSRFKSSVVETVVNATGADVEMGKLDVSPASAKLSKVHLSWSEGDTLIKSLKLKDIHSDYGMLAFIGSGIGGGALGVDKADLMLEMGKGVPNFKVIAERPVDANFDLYQCSEFNVNFGEGSMWGFSKGSVSLRTNREDGNQFRINGGLFRTPKFGDFKVQSGLVSFDSSSASVFLALDSNRHLGGVNVDGDIGYFEGSPIDLEVELRDFVLKDWMDPRARKFFNGKIKEGKGAIKMRVGDVETFDITTTIVSKQIWVNDFDFINTISEHLRDDYYLKPQFTDESKMTLRWTRRRMEFTDIDLVQDGQLRIVGALSIGEDGALSGELKVGLPVMVITGKKGRLIKEVFTEDDGAYVWADVVMSGGASDPEDDLADKFKGVIASMKKGASDDGSKEQSYEDKFRDLVE